MPTQNDLTNVVIVGGGFGGINAAKILARNTNVKVTMIDKQNYHLFQPLLYQVATAVLNPADIATPIRSILAPFANAVTYLAQAEKIDFKQNVLKTDFRSFHYDYLILACGAQHSYFGHDAWEEYAPGLKTLEQAREIRRRVFLAFEQAEREKDPEKIKSHLTFVVIGAGPTGVELAGALGEISHFALNHEFRNIDPACTRIILIEAGKRILASFSENNSKDASKDLKNLGVEVWTDCTVTDLEHGLVHVGQETIKASTILWAAGVKPAKISTSLDFPKDKHGRIIVNSDLSLKEYPNVFIIGDMAHCQDNQGKTLPGVAAVAIQQGRTAAKNILSDISNKPRKQFSYRDKGQLATIGRGRAVVEVGKFKSHGLIAWFLWLVVHIYYLIGFRNRLLVMIQWAIAFCSFKRDARIIQDRYWQSADS